MHDHPDAAPRTMLEALVRQRRWSHSEVRRVYAETANDMGAARSITEPTVSRWLGGRLKGLPYPAQSRVLERMFGVDVAVLFGPPQPLTAAVAAAHGRPEPEEEVNAAAAESARVAMTFEHTNVGPHTLEQFHADLRRIVTVYPNRPVFPLFVEVRALRDRAFELLEGRQFPNQSRELYLVAGLLCGVLSNASFDMGNLSAAETQARTAFLCAELAGHHGLRCWIRGTQALIAYWDDRPRAAIDLAVDGARYTPESGTALVRLASIEARARGMINDTDTTGALARAAAARDSAAGPDEPGGMMAFPDEKYLFYSATAQLWIGGDVATRHAERDAERSVLAYEQAPAAQRRLGELNLARLDLAAARLGHALDGAAEQVRAVLDVSSRRPTDSVRRRLAQVGAVLDRPAYQGSRLAQDLRHEITAFTTRAPIPALPAGDDR